MKRWVPAAAAALLMTACGEPKPEDVRADETLANDGAAQAQPYALQQQSAPLQNSSAPAAIRNPNASVMRFDRGVVVDASGFAKPMAAASLFVPYGWRTAGGVLWGQQYACTNGYNFEWSATAPDGSSGILILPQMKWENSTYGAQASTPGCTSAPFTSARAYLEALAQRSVPGARVIDYRDRPDLVQQAGAAPQRTPMAMGEMRSWSEAGEVLIAFQQNGRDMRGSIAALVQFSQMITDTSSLYANDPTIMQQPSASQTRMETLTGFAQPAWGAYAPNGQYDFAFFEALRRSIAVNPQWSNAIAGHNTAIGRVAIEESRKRAQIINETNAEIARIRQEVWDVQQQSADRRAREFGELLRGVQTYTDDQAPGGQRELSANYDQAWRLRDGSYVLTNDPNFDPWRDLQIEGQQLQRAP